MNCGIVRGDVCMVDFGIPTGSVQGGMRPAVVIQNNVGNAHSPTVLVAPLTSQVRKCRLPTHAYISHGDGGLHMDSVALAEQIRTVNKSDIGHVIGILSQRAMTSVDMAIRASLAL